MSKKPVWTVRQLKRRERIRGDMAPKGYWCLEIHELVWRDSEGIRHPAKTHKVDYFYRKSTAQVYARRRYGIESGCTVFQDLYDGDIFRFIDPEEDKCQELEKIDNRLYRRADDNREPYYYMYATQIDSVFEEVVLIREGKMRRQFREYEQPEGVNQS